MLVIEVFKPTYQITGTKRDETEFKVNYQEAAIRRQNKRPKPIETNIPRSGAYVDGLYTLPDNSFRPDDYDRPTLAPYINLVPLDDVIRIAEQHKKLSNQKSAKLAEK